MKEIVLIIGYNAAGKSSLVNEYINQGYHRVNRDLLGGTLDGLCDHVTTAFRNGQSKIVMDNTYATRQSRKSIIDLAKHLGAKIRCVWLTTSFENAQFNACTRMVRKHGRLLEPEEMKKTKDPNDFPPAALFIYKKNFEKPQTTEGFDDLELVPFERSKDPEYCNKALILDYDDTLRYCHTEFGYPLRPDDVMLLPGRRERLIEYRQQGYLLLGVSNQSGVAKKRLSYNDAVACFERTNQLLGLDIDYVFCPHNIPPVACYCRKPQAGNGVVLIERHKLDPSQCIFVGDQTSDATFAKRCGFQYIDQAQFFKGE